MERFRAMIEPVATTPDKPAFTPTRFSTPSTPAASSSPFLQSQSLFNPNGRPVTTTPDDINRPLGIQPLPGISDPVKTEPPMRPTWQAQLPPWLLNEPQRNFKNGY
jgi:hypothetical protein